MSGEDIAYQLRPNKFIDRQMFLELLTRLIVPRGAEKYIYVSMGGRHLVDHYAVYNALGIQAQFSFDKNPNEVARQKFNRPTGRTICVELDTADLPGKIDEIFDRFPTRENLIVWLDYTSAQRLSQFQEVVQTLVRLKHGDIFRVTLNAHPQTLAAAGEWKKKAAKGPSEYNAAQLRAQIQDFMPTDVTSFSSIEFPNILARCMELATKKAETLEPKLRIEPALITSYKDGQRMLTITCSISETGNVERFPGKLFSKWQFACRGWADIQMVSVPVLSTKEQNRLDTFLHSGVRRMLNALKFLPAADEAKSVEALKSYRTFHRYYPTFRHVVD